MEGALEGALRRLDTPYDPENEYTKASWHFSNPKSGLLLQHYETEAASWHAGPRANPYYIGIEHEGKVGEPLTEVQIANDVALLRWLAEEEKWPGFVRGITLWEHNEFMATACPSGRIPWARIIAELEGDMTEADKTELALRRAAANLAKLLADLKFQDVANALAYIGVRAK
jgi:N-acetyl-anhydromuramyl-L-alanine amidase AmpD